MSGRGRGRGRGGRGRGRGRGRGGRGRWGHGRGGGRSESPGRYGEEGTSWQITAKENTAASDELDINKDVTKFFVGTATFQQHYDAQNTNKARYMAGMTVLEKNGVEISQNSKIRCLAAAWARADRDLVDTLLSKRSLFGLVEILKALTLLDAGRQIRTIEKRVKILKMSAGKKKHGKMGKLKSDIDNLTAIKVTHGSATGAVSKSVRRWVRTLTQDELEFYALHFPRDPWKKLADICHFHPQKDFPSLPWFLPYCFGEDAPADTMVFRCKDLSSANVNALVQEFDVPYSHIKQYAKSLTPQSKERIAKYTNLDQVLWYYEDLMGPLVDKVISSRLEAGDLVTLSDGKLLERLLTLKMIREDISLTNVEYEWDERTEELKVRKRTPDPTKAPFFHKLLAIAEERLQEMSLTLESPIVIMGDRSGSMDVAIRISTIIASLLTAVTSAKLVFFNTQNMDAKFIPKNIEEVLEMAVSIEADAATSPAASLYPFYERKEVVKTFIIVTDEEENEEYKEYRFLHLYEKYCEEVYPAQLVFVSFLPDQHAPGKMVSDLKDHGYSPLQYKFYAAKPDLTKLDKLFGLLSSKTGSFEEQLSEAEKDLSMKITETKMNGLKC